MRVRAQLMVAAVLMLGGTTGFLLAARANEPLVIDNRHPVLAANLWWLAPAVIGVVWAQYLVVRYRGAVRRRLGQLVPAGCGVLAGIGLVLLGRSVVIGCGALSGAVLLLVELVILGGTLGAMSPG